MPSWKRVIVSGSNAALNSLNVTTSLTASGIIYPTTDGTSGQVVITDGNGNLSFSNVENTTIIIKNMSGGTITKGTPCYITGSGTSGNLAGVYPADASNPLRMPAGVIAGETLTAGAEGIGLINGFIPGVNTAAFNAGDSVYVAVGGGYTNVRPTGSSVLIQKLGNVEKSHASNGSGVINGPGYYNEVPNIQQGYTWVGNSSGVATPIATSSIQNVISSSFATTASYTTAISGTTNYVSKFTGAFTLGNSLIYDNGTNVGIGTTSPTNKFVVSDGGNLGLEINPNYSGESYIAVYNRGTSAYGNLNLEAANIYFRTGTSPAIKGIVNSSGNFGIGTTSPSTKLHVSGAGAFGGIIYPDYNTDTGTYIDGATVNQLKLYADSYLVGFVGGSERYACSTSQFYTSNSTSISSGDRLYITTVDNAASDTDKFLVLNGTEVEYRTGTQLLSDIGGQAALTNPVTGTGTTNYVSKFIGSTTLGNSQIFDNGTNVGIGTTNPLSKLQIATGNSLTITDPTSYAVWFSNNDGARGVIIGYNNSNNTGVISSIYKDVAWTNLSINPNGGNVGIGTSSPAGRLSIVDGYYNTFFADTSSQYGSGLILSGDAGSDQRSWRTFVKNGNGAVALTFEVSTNGTSYGSSPTGLTYAERMRITSGGNVGIGTTSPSEKLEVQNGPSGAKIKVSNTGGGYATLECSSNATSVAQLSFTNQLSLIGGNVGIGTSSPFRTLDVNGTLRLQSPTIDLGNSTDNQIWVSSNNINFKTNGSEKAIITSAGNVGIGTSSPTAKLHVTDTNKTFDGYGNVNIFTSDAAAVDKGGSIAFGGVNATGGTSPYVFAKIQGIKEGSTSNYNGTLILGTTSNSSAVTEKMRITAAGNVGIGTSSPAHTLSVSGNASISNNSSLFLLDTAGNTGFQIRNTNSNVALIHQANNGTLRYRAGFSSNSSNNHIFAVGGDTEIVRFTNDGNVGIGTSSPSFKLEVSGSDASINGVRVGRGAGSISTNTVVGTGSLSSNTSGQYNTAVGANTLTAGTTGAANTAIGEGALKSNTGSGNTAIGRYAGYDNTSGNVNILIGTSLNYQPDNTNFNGSYTLSIGKNSIDLEGYPHIWAPDTVTVSNSTNTTILTIDPSVYSGFFLEYTFDDTNGLMRSGTIKAIFTFNMSGIQWSEVDVLSIGNSSAAIFSVVDNGSSKIDVKLDNNTGGTLFCNFTSRLILRQL